MYKTQSNQIRKLDKIQYNILRKLTWHSARLYNFALYTIRQTYFETKTYLSYPQNYHICKTNDNYKIMPSAAAQQTLKVVDRGFKSFFSLLKLKNKGKYQSRISIPNYLPKGSYFQLLYPKTMFHIKGSTIHLGISKQMSKEMGIKDIVLDFPTQINKNDVVEIRIVPQYNAKYFKMEVVYEVENQDLGLNKENVLSIDIGLSNLATCYDVSNNRAFIMDGKQLKSINYFWNKQNAKLQSIKDKQNIRGYTKRQFLIKQKRWYRIKDVMRKTIKHIIDYCIANDIGTIIVGHNKGWKNHINIGKINNQNFTQIPFGYLMRGIESKCNEYGLRYLEIQESHTSICSAIDSESIKHHYEYVGKRIKRGLFRTKNGLLVNSDVNGAINIARKSKVTSIEIAHEMVKGIVAYPKRIRV